MRSASLTCKDTGESIISDLLSNGADNDIGCEQSLFFFKDLECVTIDGELREAETTNEARGTRRPTHLSPTFLAPDTLARRTTFEQK